MKGILNMKRALKTIAILLVVITVFSCFASCSSKGKTLMELDGTKMSVNTFMLFLSRMKGNLASAYHYGTEALKTDFWDSVRDASGTTNNDYYTDLVLEDANTYLAALYLFDELGLKLPDSYIEEIDTKMDAKGRGCAAVSLKLSRAGGHLYCSSAGDNSASIFKIDQNSGMLEKLCSLLISGNYPKDLDVFPDDKTMVVLNHESDQIRFFHVDYEKKLFVEKGRPIKVETPNSIMISKLS